MAGNQILAQQGTTGDRPRRTVYDSAAPVSPSIEALLELWHYRDLLTQLIDRDVKIRYKRSVLGVAWTMLNPLLMMIVLTLVFSQVFRFDLPNYPVYLLSGMIVWNFFAQSTVAAMSQLTWAGSLLTRIYVPKTVFVLAAVGTGLVNLFLALVPLLLIMLVTGVPFSLALLWLPVPVVIVTIFTLGIGLLVSALAIFFNDIISMYELLLSTFYFLTPVMYPPSIVADDQRWLLLSNPMYYMVAIFRAPIYEAMAPNTGDCLIASAVALATLVIGWRVFTSRADQIVYYL